MYEREKEREREDEKRDRKWIARERERKCASNWVSVCEREVGR